jgi:prephenate dehydrogenase
MSTCAAPQRYAPICRETDAMGAGDGRRLLVVGTGLIGTSVALAARAAGYDVWLENRDPDRLAMAVAMGAGQARTAGLERVDLAVAAVPPTIVARVVHDLIQSDVAATVTHVCSVQSEPQREVEALLHSPTGFVGSHPVAGRERTGPHHASADLFVQRPWIVCPTEYSSAAAVATVSGLAQACGALVTTMSAVAHDALLARLSHAPQLMASALAGALVGLNRDEVALAGTGLRDTSRLADSDAGLWAEIVAANPLPVAGALRAIIEPLSELIAVLDAADPVTAARAVHDLVSRGKQGRDLLAGKPGQAVVRWATVSVVVPDEPGALARLLVEAAEADVNVEDIRVDHSPGQPLGMVELDVAPDRGDSLERELVARGWTASASPPPPD